MNFICPPILQHAIASTPEARYYGTKSTMNLWRPAVATSKDFSLAQLWISAGSYSRKDLNTIEAGWQVRSQWETYIDLPSYIIYAS
jgi:hypothetical protein